jgi:aminoglycoside phosphotransferase
MTSASIDHILHAASASAGIDASGAQVVHAGENTTYRLPLGIIARITRPGQLAAARREVAVARWLSDAGIAAVRGVEGVEQPAEIDGRAVTFWHELPPHSPGTPEQVAGLLRRLHALPAPSDPFLPVLDPFVRIRKRLDGSDVIPDDDRQWLLERLGDQRATYATLPTGLRHAPVHGDAWTGNVVATEDGTVLLIDLERFSFGAPEWDLVSTAIRYTSYGTLNAHDYRAFADRYGHDVTTWPGYPTLRDIRELRVVAYAVQLAGEHPNIRDQAIHRIACLRGLRPSALDRLARPRVTGDKPRRHGSVSASRVGRGVAGLKSQTSEPLHQPSSR